MDIINLNNYEAYLLDYFEGNLSEELCAELNLFVITHPELEINLEDKSLPTFNDEKPDLDLKSLLKKTELNFPDEVVLNYLDNNLSEAEQKAFEDKLLKDKDLTADLDLYKKTKLFPDPSLTFDNRTALQKTDDDFVLNNRPVAYYENTLSELERSGFESDLKTDLLLQKDVELLSKTKIVIDSELVFPNKETLKKENKVIALFNLRGVGTLAAAVLLLIGLAFIFSYYDNANTPEVAVRMHRAEHKTQQNKVQSYPEQDLPKAETNKGKTSNPANNRSYRNNSLNNERAIAKATMVKSEKNLKSNSAASRSEPDPQINAPLVKETKSNEPAVEKEITDPLRNQVADYKPANPQTMRADTVISSELTARPTVLSVLEEATDDEEETEPTKNGFWKRAVKFAKSVNRLGLKALDGVEKPNESYALSFNSFSVEKH